MSARKINEKMDRTEFERLGRMLFNDHPHWQHYLAKRMRLNGSTIRRYTAGTRAISKPVAEFLRTLVHYETDAAMEIRDEALARRRS